MLPRPLFVGFLAGLGLLSGPTLPGRGQGIPPSPDQGGQLAPPSPALPPADGNGDCGPAGPPGLTPFDTARPPSPWYADAEVAALFNAAVHFNGHVSSVVGDHPVYVSPRAFLGYRFDDGSSVRFTYRNLTEVGRVGQDPSPGDWRPERTFTTNWADLDYVSREYAPLACWRLWCEAGGRLVYRYEWWGAQDLYLRDEASTTFFGGGPHLGLTSRAPLGSSGWELFGRADGAVTFGGAEATFRSTPRQADPWGYVAAPFAERFSTSACQFDLGLQVGLMKRWQLERCAVGLGFGVRGDVLSRGNLGGGDFDVFGLLNAGVFLRCEVGF